MNPFFTALRILLLLVSVAGAAGTVCSVFRQESPAPTRQEFDLKLRFLREIIKDVGDRGGTVDLENVDMGYYIPSDGEDYD